jgi:hypothetical protein
MTQEEFIEQLLTSIGKCFVFLRPAPSEKMEIIKRKRAAAKGNSKKGHNHKNVDVWHYSALSIISRLTNNGEIPCSHKQLRDIFLWRHPNAGNKFDDTVLKTLDDIGLIKRSLQTDELKGRSITLTDLGKQILVKIGESRRKDVAVIAANLEIDDEADRQKIVNTLSHLGDLLWKHILKEAESEASKKQNVTKKKVTSK